MHTGEQYDRTFPFTEHMNQCLLFSLVQKVSNKSLSKGKTTILSNLKLGNGKLIRGKSIFPSTIITLFISSEKDQVEFNVWAQAMKTSKAVVADSQVYKHVV